MDVLTFMDYILDPIVIVNVKDKDGNEDRFLTNICRICTGDDYHTIPEEKINPRDYPEIFKGLKPKDITPNALYDTYRSWKVQTIEHGMLGDFIGIEISIGE